MPNGSKPIPSRLLNPSENFKKFKNNRQLKINIKQRLIILGIDLSKKYKFFFFSGAVVVLCSVHLHSLNIIGPCLDSLLFKIFINFLSTFYIRKI